MPDPGTLQLAIAGTVLLVLLAGLIGTRLFLAKVAAQVRAITGGPPGHDLERELRQHTVAVKGLLRRIEDLERRIANTEEGHAGALQRLGFIRFNAFADTGSDQSFSLALLDGRGSGFVLTSLYGRSESRVYAKPLLDGKCPYKLSDEEQQALRGAGDGKAWLSAPTGHGASLPEPRGRKPRARTGRRAAAGDDAGG
ncbi:MAG TPA: DUF4446 domain-containing protein [Clostridiales bacterium]|nr:DUF4446 domain-containing protein [Clostridiales bacterium]